MIWGRKNSIEGIPIIEAGKSSDKSLIVVAGLGASPRWPQIYAARNFPEYNIIAMGPEYRGIGNTKQLSKDIKTIVDYQEYLGQEVFGFGHSGGASALAGVDGLNAICLANPFDDAQDHLSWPVRYLLGDGTNHGIGPLQLKNIPETNVPTYCLLGKNDWKLSLKNNPNLLEELTDKLEQRGYKVNTFDVDHKLAQPNMQAKVDAIKEFTAGNTDAFWDIILPYHPPEIATSMQDFYKQHTSKN